MLNYLQINKIIKYSYNFNFINLFLYIQIKPYFNEFKNNLNK